MVRSHPVTLQKTSTPAASLPATRRGVARCLVGVLLVLMALGLASAAGAQAESTNDLGWKLNGKALGEAETTPITALAEGVQVFKEGILLKIECSRLELLSAKLVGGKSSAPGKGEGRIAYSGCVIPPYECKVSGISKPLVATTAYVTKAAAEKEELAAGLNGLVLAPKEGEVFVELVASRPMLGRLCPFEEPITFAFKGSVLAKVLKGSGETTYNEEGQKHLIEATALKAYFENEGGKAVEHSGVGLKLGETEATWSGKANMSVAAGSKYNLML
jgi:hypothetical protein